MNKENILTKERADEILALINENSIIYYYMKTDPQKHDLKLGHCSFKDIEDKYFDFVIGYLLEVFNIKTFEPKELSREEQEIYYNFFNDFYDYLYKTGLKAELLLYLPQTIAKHYNML